MWVEQAIFTSLMRRGKAGYHVVARSPGVTDSEANSLATWSPSHGALIVDAANRASINYHPLPGARVALSRTCLGPSEYSGRGGRQVYTHALIVESAKLARAGVPPIALYRDALALGRFRYQADPKPVLAPVELCFNHTSLDVDAALGRARTLGFPAVEPHCDALLAGESRTIVHDGDRLALLECLCGMLPVESTLAISFATSLQRSIVRPFRLLIQAPERRASS